MKAPQLSLPYRVDGKQLALLHLSLLAAKLRQFNHFAGRCLVKNLSLGVQVVEGYMLGCR